MTILITRTLKLLKSRKFQSDQVTVLKCMHNLNPEFSAISNHTIFVYKINILGAQQKHVECDIELQDKVLGIDRDLNRNTRIMFNHTVYRIIQYPLDSLF